MKTILTKILDALGKKLPDILIKALNAVQTVFSFLEKRQDAKNQEKLEKKEDQNEKLIEDACDKGGISDLLDLGGKLKSAAIVAGGAAVLSGCATTIEIKPVEPWEGRYSTVSDFREKAGTVELKKGQSVWLISNDTLRRVINDTRKKK